MTVNVFSQNQLAQLSVSSSYTFGLLRVFCLRLQKDNAIKSDVTQLNAKRIRVYAEADILQRHF